MGKQKTNDEFLAEVYDIVKDEYTFLEPYVNNRTKINVRHNHCGHIYLVSPGNFLKGNRCPKCTRKRLSKQRKKSNEQFIQEVRKMVGEEYTFLEKYKGATTKILVRHNKCGNKYKVAPSNFFSGKRCPECAKKHVGRCNALTEKEFKTRLENVSNGEYIALEPYKNGYTKIKFLHLKCRNIFKSQPRHVLTGHGCPICGYQSIGEKLRKTHEEYVKEIYELVQNEYTVLGEYKNDSTKIKFRHNKCGRTFVMNAGSFLRGTRCPHCAESKGEKEIYNFLQSKNIPFCREYRDKRCKHKYTLPFDFAIISKGKVLALIEYDGELHFKPGKWANAFEKYKSIKKTEKIKNNFCQKYNIPLIRIPYWEKENINKILENKLKALGVLK